MDKGVETRYTKRNNLAKHLLGCGGTKEKKFKCTYEKCNAAYIRQDNLKQHIAIQHTHVFLYKCKKCGNQFHTSPEATAHRKIVIQLILTRNILERKPILRKLRIPIKKSKKKKMHLKMSKRFAVFY